VSYEDLEEHNVFLPEEVWGKVDLSASVNQSIVFAVFTLGVGSCVLMYLGHGSALTWIGTGLYVLFMYIFMFVSNRGIKDQNEQIDRLLENRSEPPREG